MPPDKKWEFEPWLYSFKMLYADGKGPPLLDYRHLRYLLDLWHEGKTPQDAVEIAKERVEGAPPV